MKEKKWKNKKNKSILIVVLILALTTSAGLAIFPSVIAQKTHTKKTHLFIGATPNPVDFGQETLPHLGIANEMQNVQNGYKDITITVEKPDPTTETKEPAAEGPITLEVIVVIVGTVAIIVGSTYWFLKRK